MGGPAGEWREVRRTAYSYAWDVLDAPREADAMRACGLNGATVTAAYHAGKFVVPHGPRRVVFPEDGTATFRHDPVRYGDLAPLPHSLLADHDPLADMAREMPVTAWTVLLHNSRLGHARPDCCAVNAFGDPYLYSLCPTHPEVRDYAIALLADLTARYDLEAVAIETPGYLPYAHGYHHEFQQLRLTPWLETLLGLSFAPSDVEGATAAGIDAAGLRARVAARIDAYLGADVDVDADVSQEWMLADLLSDLAELPAYCRWQAGRVTALVAEIAEAARDGVAIGVIPTVQRPTAAAWREGTDLAALAEAAGFLEVPHYEHDPSRTAADRFDVRSRAGSGARLGAILRPAHPDMAGAEAIRAHVAAVSDDALLRLSFYNWGLMRPRDRRALAEALT